MTRSKSQRPESAAKTVDRYQVLFENSGEPILIIEQDRFVDCNQAAVDMLGYSDKEAVLQCHPSEISPEYQSDGQRSENKANGILTRIGDVPYQCFEWTHVKADGTLFPVEVSLTAIPVNGGYTIHTTWRDISERKRLEQELRHAQKMDAVGKLAGGIAHDFNNQLVPMLGYSELLQNALEDEPEMAEWAAEIHRAAGFAAMLVDKLLWLSRKDHQVPVILDMDAAVTELLRILRKLIGEDIKIDLQSAGRPLWVKIAPGDIEQTLLNLASNSRDALPEGGEIRITLSQVRRVGKDFACLEVSDNGAGMDEDTLLHIYEPFFTTKEIGSGTGLGLSTVYDTVTNAGGRVDASSSPGKGTTFEVLLPMVEADEVTLDAARDQGVASEPTTSIGKDSRHILIVEDNAQIALFVARVLREQGFRVSAAGNGQQALHFLSTEIPDLILTDVIMDEMGGPMMVRELEKQGTDVPVVFMSGHTDDRLAAAGFDVSQLKLLRKPFSAAALVDQVGQALVRKER